eukprot:911857-Amphidinium_carterae.1
MATIRPHMLRKDILWLWKWATVGMDRHEKASVISPWCITHVEGQSSTTMKVSWSGDMCHRSRDFYISCSKSK